jgi:hypothetical protein
VLQNAGRKLSAEAKIGGDTRRMLLEMVEKLPLHELNDLAWLRNAQAPLQTAARVHRPKPSLDHVCAAQPVRGYVVMCAFAVHVVFIRGILRMGSYNRCE